MENDPSRGAQLLHKALYAAGPRSSCAIWMSNTIRKMAMNTLDSSRIMKRKYFGCFSHQLAGILGWNTLGLSGRTSHRFPRGR